MFDQFDQFAACAAAASGGEAIGAWARVENAACARRLSAISDVLEARRAEDGSAERDQWCLDNWDAVAAEVAAAHEVPLPPAFERVAPEPPSWLDAEGRQEWARVVTDLEPLGLLKNSDRAILTAHCEAWSRFVAAVRCYRADGVVKVNPDSGRLGKHAAVAVAEQAAVQMAKLGGLLGLSPVAERGLGSFAPPNPDDPFAG